MMPSGHTNKQQQTFIPASNQYRNAKIYRIVSNQTQQQYIGSTIQPLKYRLADHARDYIRYQRTIHKRNGAAKLQYISSFEIMKYADAAIQLIEEYPCASKSALETREGYHIRNNTNCVNKVIPGRVTLRRARPYIQHHARCKKSRFTITRICKKAIDDMISQLQDELPLAIVHNTLDTSNVQ
jgi:hypothetical protein